MSMVWITTSEGGAIVHHSIEKALNKLAGRWRQFDAIPLIDRIGILELVRHVLEQDPLDPDRPASLGTDHWAKAAPEIVRMSAATTPAVPVSSLTLTESDLEQFSGSETMYKHMVLPDYRYSEGVQYVAKHGNAYWLVDQILISQDIPKVAKVNFQVWTLEVAKERSAILYCTDGNDNAVFIAEPIPSTDFPLDKIVFWLQDKTLYLPRES